MKRNLAVLAILVICSLVFVVGFVAAGVVALQAPVNRLVVKNQPVGPSLFVDAVWLKQPGFLVIYKLNGSDQPRLVGQSDYFPKGVWPRVHIGPFAEEILSELKPGDRLEVVMVRDNGDKQYNQLLDRPALEQDGQIVKKRILFW